MGKSSEDKCLEYGKNLEVFLLKKVSAKTMEASLRDMITRELFKLYVHQVIISFHVILYNISPQVDRLEDELISEQEKFKAINEELEQTFAEMSGY